MVFFSSLLIHSSYLYPLAKLSHGVSQKVSGREAVWRGDGEEATRYGRGPRPAAAGGLKDTAPGGHEMLASPEVAAVSLSRFQGGQAYAQQRALSLDAFKKG
jgi:hypothetical protein